MTITTISSYLEDIANAIGSLADDGSDDAGLHEALLRALAEARARIENLEEPHSQFAQEVLLRIGNALGVGSDDGVQPDIDALIEFPEFLNRLGLPDVEFARINEGPTEDGGFQYVMGFNVFDPGDDAQLVITGGANGDLFQVGDDGRSLQARQLFEFDLPQDSGIANLLPVEVALRDADGNLFDHTRVYVAVRPKAEEEEAAFMASLEEPLRQEVVDMLPFGAGARLLDHVDGPIARYLFDPDNDLVFGGLDDDLFQGGDGHDVFLGLTGHDTVTYDGVRADFVPDWIDGCCVTVDKPGGETDRHYGIERLSFDDGDLLYDIDSPNLGFAYRMYKAGYGRTPDEEGLRHWTGVLDYLDANEPWLDKKDFLADQFVGADEFKALYGAAPGNEDFVDAMYGNVLGRLPDAAGRAFWVDGMERGLGYDDVLVAFAQSHENVANTLEHIDDGVWVA